MTNIFLIRPKGQLLNFGSKLLSQWFLKANVTVLFWICPAPYQVLEFQNLEQFLEFQELCVVNMFIFQVEVISCRVSSSIFDLCI